MKGRVVLYTVLMLLLMHTAQSQPKKEHNLVFDSLAKRWDEAIPLGNGWLGY